MGFFATIGSIILFTIVVVLLVYSYKEERDRPGRKYYAGQYNDIWAPVF